MSDTTNTSSNDQEELDIGLLDMGLDEIETLPGFETPVEGEYILDLKSALKKVGKNIVVETAFELLECVKKNNDEDPDSQPGTKFSNIYTIKSGDTDPDKRAEAERMGKGKLKELLLGISETANETNVGVLVRDVIGHCQVKATVKRRQDKEDKEKFYPVIKNMMLA
jgi:hypothetical protein